VTVLTTPAGSHVTSERVESRRADLAEDPVDRLRVVGDALDGVVDLGERVAIGLPISSVVSTASSFFASAIRDAYPSRSVFRSGAASPAQAPLSRAFQAARTASSTSAASPADHA
jgi:hypothetical protein